MTATLPASDRAKLVKLLALIDSPHDGEAVAAALAAARLVKKCGLSWSEVIEPHAVKREPLWSKWRETCAQLQRRQNDLRQWERTFVADLPGFQRISTKQRYVLAEIAKRVLGDGAP